MVIPSAQRDGEDQVVAGARLVQWSRLANWDAGAHVFRAAEFAAFSGWWPSVECRFGRLISWLVFSVGSEYLAKGVCLLNGIEGALANDQDVLPFPEGQPVGAWARAVRKGQVKMMKTRTYGTLGALFWFNKAKNLSPPLLQLCKKAGLSEEATDLVWAGFRLLHKSIRNRDAHLFVADARDLHFCVLEPILVPSLNVLTGCLPGGGKALTDLLKSKWAA